MSDVLERFLIPREYRQESPERKVSIDGRPTSVEYEPHFSTHLNKYRPLWAIEGMRTKVMQLKGFTLDGEEMHNQIVSFTLTLWSPGIHDGSGSVFNIRIVCKLKEAAAQTSGLNGLEKAIARLVYNYVERPVKQRFAPRGPSHIVSGISRIQKAIEDELCTQVGGPTRADLTGCLSDMKDVIEKMPTKQK